jgi:predicted amidohydrolase
MVDAMARQAGERGWELDLAILPETFAEVDGSPPADSAQALDGDTVRAVAERARRYRTHAVVPLRLRQGDRVHNSVVLLDRAGRVAGLYHKVFPVVFPDGTVEGGITPGSQFPVFDLDFGRVGVQICFDVCYDEGWTALAEGEAELVVFPSDSPAVTALAAQAFRHGYYIASATYRPPAVVLDPLGTRIAQAAADRQVAVVRVDLDYRILPSRFTWTRGPQVREKYGDRVDFGWHDAEGFCLLTSRDPALPLRRLLEVEQLETSRQFVARNREAQVAARGGPPGGP